MITNVAISVTWWYNTSKGGEKLESERLAQFVGNKIKELRDKRGMTQEELGEVLGISKQALGRYESGQRRPNQDAMFQLADFFNVSLDSFFPERKSRNINIIYDQLSEPRQVKVYDFAEIQLNEQKSSQTFTVYGQTAAGSPLEYGQDAVEERETSYIPKGAEVALIVNGNSMEPTYPNGSIVFYKRQPQVENGSVAIVEVDGGVTCKKIKFDYENEKVILQSINPDYEDVLLNADEVKVLGLVVK